MRRVGLLLGLAFFAVAAGLAAQEKAPAQADPRVVVGAPTGRPLSGRLLEQRTETVGALLRCPVCQGLSVTDSPSDMAVKMKAQVSDMLAAGYERNQVLAYFEHSYGEFVLLQPRMRGVNWLVWLMPLLALVAGAALVTGFLRRKASANRERPAESADPPSIDLPGADTLPDDPALAARVLEVRELAYGWPGGVSPAAGDAAGSRRSLSSR